MTPKYDAILVNVGFMHWGGKEGGAVIAAGHILEDNKKRFIDGEQITTSVIQRIEPLDELFEIDGRMRQVSIVHTLNTKYLAACEHEALEEWIDATTNPAYITEVLNGYL